MPCIKNFGRSLDKNTHKNVKKRVVLSCVERNMMFLHKKVSIERYKYWKDVENKTRSFKIRTYVNLQKDKNIVPSYYWKHKVTRSHSVTSMKP